MIQALLHKLGHSLNPETLVNTCTLGCSGTGGYALHRSSGRNIRIPFPDIHASQEQVALPGLPANQCWGHDWRLEPSPILVLFLAKAVLRAGVPSLTLTNPDQESRLLQVVGIDAETLRGCISPANAKI